MLDFVALITVAGTGGEFAGVGVFFAATWALVCGATAWC